MTLVELLSSAVVSSLVAALVTLRSGERKIEIENVTQERAKWRDKVRLTALQVHQAAVAGDLLKVAELHLTFELILNPNDGEDNQLLGCIKKLEGGDAPQSHLPEFSKRVALLLKHDWDRAKLEAKPWPFGKAVRVKYTR